MKRIKFMLAVGAVAVACVLGASAQSESLGDAARAARKEPRPPAKKVYTNDNLPTTASISVVGAPPAEEGEQKSAAKPPEARQPAPAKEAKAEEKKAPQSDQAWQSKFEDQKKTVAALEKELDLLQREYKLQVANYYADAGNALRDSKAWAEQDAKFRSEIADKQKQLDEAKSHLQDTEEQARQAGASSSGVQ